MAENKKSFILYCDLIHTIEKMPSDKAGELFKHILMYVNDMNPQTEDLIINLTFEPIKQQLKRDLKKFEEVKEIKSNGGRLGNLKRWNEDLHKQVIDKKLTLEEAEKIAESRKTSHTDIVPSHTIAKIAVNDNVNVNDNDINNNIDLETLEYELKYKKYHILELKNILLKDEPFLNNFKVGKLELTKEKRILMLNEFYKNLEDTQQLVYTREDFLKHLKNWASKVSSKK